MSKQPGTTTLPSTPTAKRAKRASMSTVATSFEHQLAELRRFPRGTDVSALTARLDQLAEIIAETSGIPEPVDADLSSETAK